jgi:nicotinamide phosphoribosyltransferase
MNIQEYFAPKATDIKYDVEKWLRISLICRIDSYKFSHPFGYPEAGELGDGEEIVGMTSYGTARISEDAHVVSAGMQILVKSRLMDKITMEDVDAAEQFAIGHFGRPLFARPAWERVVREYDGKLPLIIRSVPEGTLVPGKGSLYTVTAFGADIHWMSAAFETLIQRGVWYPTTIATNDYESKQIIKRFYLNYGGDLALLPFALHDFGGRGVTCSEQAEIGGGTHTFNFMGSDTVEGVIAANFYYKSAMSAYSVYATEHSIQCSYGKDKENQLKYIRHQLKKVKALGLPIVSIVLDGYDVIREAESCCNELRDEIIEFGGKVVFRPDSGNMYQIVPTILEMQAKAFGFELVTGADGVPRRRIKHVGIIQGDGIDATSMAKLLAAIVAAGFTPDCVIFGSGGALLQKVNRDTYKFAQKACAILIKRADGSTYWKDISKDPITDPGKRSEGGVLTLAKNLQTGEIKNIHLNNGGIPDGWVDLHVLVYYYGDAYNETTLDEIRERLA